MDKMEDIKKILKKMKITEDEAMVLFKHCTKRFIEEECYLSLSLDSGVEYQSDSKYINLSSSVSLIMSNDNGIEDKVLLQDKETTSIFLN